jgi:hypothetical protein
MPLLTTAAYTSPYSGFPDMPKTFYDFYANYVNTPVGTIVNDSTMNWLKVNVGSNDTGEGAFSNNNGWGASLPLYQFLTSDQAAECGMPKVSVVTDLGIANGSLFSHGMRNFDVLVVGHDEYVSLDELTQLQQFVASGGRVVLMDGDNWEVQVGFDYWTQCLPAHCYKEPHETFMQGHGWTFNGKFAKHSGVWNQFPAMDIKLTAELLPSTYGGEECWNVSILHGEPIGKSLLLLYGPTVFRNVVPHEPSRLVNLSDTSLIMRCNGPVAGVSAYDHQYGQGDVISYLGTGSVTIAQSNVTKSFLLESILTYSQAPLLTAQPNTLTIGGLQGIFASCRNSLGIRLDMVMLAVWRNPSGRAVAVASASASLGLGQTKSVFAPLITRLPSGTYHIEVMFFEADTESLLSSTSIIASF